MPPAKPNKSANDVVGGGRLLVGRRHLLIEVSVDQPGNVGGRDGRAARFDRKFGCCHLRPRQQRADLVDRLVAQRELLVEVLLPRGVGCIERRLRLLEVLRHCGVGNGGALRLLREALLLRGVVELRAPEQLLVGCCCVLQSPRLGLLVICCCALLPNSPACAPSRTAAAAPAPPCAIAASRASFACMV